MIELQRKTIYLQKLELQQLKDKHGGLIRNFEALGQQVLLEKLNADQLSVRVQDLEKERDKLQLQVKDAHNKANLAAFGADFEQKRDAELKELRDMNEAKRDEIYALKTELNQKQ